jgi:hypothetical protein
MKEQNNRSEFTIGLDLGERRHRFCALDGKGEVMEEGTLGNDRVSLGRLSARYRGALAVGLEYAFARLSHSSFETSESSRRNSYFKSVAEIGMS